MGNAKSTGGGAHHEKLDDGNERYFDKVRARNEVTSKKERRRRHHHPHQQQQQNKSPPRVERNPATDRKTSEQSPAASRSSNAGPLKSSTTLQLTVAQAKSEHHLRGSNNKQHGGSFRLSRGKSEGRIRRLPQPRSQRSVYTASDGNTMSASQRRLQKARGGSGDGGSHQRRPSKPQFFADFFNDNKDNGNNKGGNEAFEAMLPSGMVWADISRTGKVTCLALTKSAPLLLAIGTDDGNMSVMEIQDESDPLPEEGLAAFLGQSFRRRKKKFGHVKELPREGKVRSVHFSPDGDRLIVGGDDCTACLVEVGYQIQTQGGVIHKRLDSLEIVHELEREDRVYAVQFSPDGKMVAVGGFDGMLTIAAVTQDSLDLVAEVPRLGLVLSVDWSPDGSLLAVGGSDKRAAIVDTSGTWEVFGEIQRSASVHCVRWSPDGHYLAVGGHDGTVAVVDIESRTIMGEIVRGAEEEDQTPTGTACRISALSWSPDDGAFLAIGGSDDTCAIVETKSFVPVHEVKRAGHITCLDWANQRTGYLAVGGDDRSVAILKTGDINLSAEDEASYASNSMFSGGNESEWTLKDDTFADVDDYAARKKNKKPASSTKEVASVAFSRSVSKDPSAFMAVATADGKVMILSTVDWGLVTEMSFSSAIRSLKFSNTSSEYLALGGDEAIVYMVAVDGWTVVRETACSAPILALDFNESDERLAVGTSHGVLTILDAEGDWGVVGEMDSSDSSILCLDWSSTTKYLAVGRDDSTVTIHNSQKIKDNFFVAQAELSRGGPPVHSVAFGVGGRFLAVGGGDWTVAIYSAKGGWVLCNHVKTDGIVTSVVWDSDGRYLGYGGKALSKGGEVVDTISWDPIEELGTNLSDTPGVGIGEDTSCVDWSNDDRWMVFAGGAGVSRIVDTSTWDVAFAMDHSGNITEYAGSGGQNGVANEEEYYESDDEDHEEFLHAKMGVATSKAKNKSSSKGKNTKSILNDLAATETTRSNGSFHSADIDWNEQPIVEQFLEVCTEFLAPYKDADPPNVLRMYVPCILMLEVHVKWIGSLDAKTRSKVMEKDGGEPLSALFGILHISVHVMTQVLDTEDDIEEWWKSSANFELSSKDLKGMNRWNEAWREVDAEAPTVDTDLLTICDQMK